MASDQNSIPVDLRPLNLTRAAVAEDPRIAPVSTSGRNIEGFFPNQARDVGSPIARPVYYPASIPDSGFVGVGYSNVSPGLAWCPRMPTAFAHAASVSSTGAQVSNPNFSPQAGGSNASQASSEGGDDSVSGNKVKFLCSFGGKILPRPSDGMLRYVGGQTRIVGVRRDASFNELMQKLVNTCGHPVIIKYQLPDEDLDALVSISCRDDLDNMMDEYEKLLQRSSDGSCKLRLFLFSASEIDPPGMAHFGDLRDSGQRYVDAVNGMVDEFRGGITRKESIASVASTQNSDLSGNDASDSLGIGQLDNTGPALGNILSPRENNGISNETAQKIVLTEPNSSTFIATTSNLLGTPVKSTPQASLSSTDSEIERPIAFTRQHQPTGLTLQQPVVETPPAAPYLPSYMDSKSGAVNAQYLSSQMRFQNPQAFRTPGSVFTQPQFHENPTSSHQYIAVQHMTIAPPSSNIGVVHPFMQAHQTQLENVPKQSTFWPRVVPLPGNQGFSAYQTHVPPTVLGGGYASQQGQPSGHVTSPDSWAAQPMVVFPERAPRLEDCYMCQKALPHAHSDTYAQDQKNSTISSSNSAYHSLRPEDHRINWPLNKAGISGALGEGIVDMHGPAAIPGALVHMDNQGAPPKEPVGISQNLEVAHETEGFMPYKMDNPNDTMMSIAHGAMGMTGDVHSPYGAFVGTMPSYKVDAVPPLPVPTKFQNRPDNLLNKHAVPDGPPIVGVPSQYVEHVAYESPKDYSPKPSELVPKDEFVDLSSSHDTWRPINGRIANLKFQNISNEKNKPPVDMLRKDDLLEHRQQFVKAELPSHGTSLLPRAVVDVNQTKATEMPLYSDASYHYNFPAVDPYEVGQKPNHEMLNEIHQPLSGEVCFGSSGVNSGVDSVIPVTEWKDNTWKYQPNPVANNAENVPSTSTKPISPSAKPSDIQDSPESLFSIQDPWNYHHDAHLLPPKSNKIATKKEAIGARDPFSPNQLGNGGNLLSEVRADNELHQGHADTERNLISEHVQSDKEELIGQELQAVAVDVAASVLQSSTSHSDIPALDGDGSVSEGYRNAKVPDSNAELKDMKTKFSEKTNHGFPVSDGIGRLQIIKNNDLEELNELGSGTFGTVYHGKWRGTDVAIKRINDRCFSGKNSEQERMRDDFWNEAIKLADLHHPNVVAFYGVVLDGPGGSVATVTEYMVNGSLRTALQRNGKNLDKRKRLLIAMDVAFGMEYLHGKNIVHFDLKSDNLLVNLRDPHRPICKVGDLGLSKVKCQTLISGGVRGTLPWMAPELLNGSSSLVSEKVDVFSFGIVLWELLTGEEPYADLHYGAIIGGIVSNTLRPAIPDSCDPEWRSLMERCWSSETLERPTFTDIANQLRSMASKIPPRGQAQQQQQPQIQK